MKEIIRLENIKKIYPNGVVANDGINITFCEGEIHAIAGENGAGKSTLMKIMYGVEAPSSGTIFYNNNPITINSPKVANKLGIGMVFQHFMLVNEFKVYQNIFFGNEIKNKLGILNNKKMIQETIELEKKYDMFVDPKAITSELSVVECQKVEILKVLERGAKIIILDEPTAVLTPQETKELFKQIRLLKENNYTIIIITHKLNEIKELCDRVSIIRNGKSFGTFDVKDISTEEISSLMIGKKIDLCLNKSEKNFKEILVDVDNLSIKGQGDKELVHNVSFQAHAGEIVCFAGVEGNGQKDVVDALVGKNNNYHGTITINNKNIDSLSVNKIRNLGLAHIPEDRMSTGCNLSASILDNFIALSIKEESTAGILNKSKLKKETDKVIDKYSIKGKYNTPISMLSGGNMQKVVLARELESNPIVVIADQPTRGVDIGAIHFIHNKILELRDQGLCIILISADLSEVLNLADTILVFHNGEITAKIDDVSSINEEILGQYMLGIKRMEVNDNEK